MDAETMSQEDMETALRQWQALDKSIKAAESQLRVHKKRRGVLSKALSNVMVEVQIDRFATSAGDIALTRKTQTAGLTKKLVLQGLQSFFADRGDIDCEACLAHILGQRTTKEVHGIVQKRPQKKS